MTIIRSRRPENGYLSIANETVRDPRLSYRARGLLVSILSRPDDWRTSARALAAETQGEGRDAVATAMRELVAAGYVVVVRDQDPETGLWITVNRVYDCPQVDAQDVAEHPVSPKPENPPPKPENPASGFPGRIRSTDTKDLSQPPSDEGVTSAPTIQGEDVDNRDVRRHPHWPNVLVAVTALAHDNDLDRNELLALIAAHAPTDPWTGYLAVKHQVYVVGLGDARDATKVLSHRLADMNLARPVDADKCSAHLLPHPCPGCAADRKAVSANLPRSNPGGSPVHAETAPSASQAVSGAFSTRQGAVSATGGGQ